MKRVLLILLLVNSSVLASAQMCTDVRLGYIRLLDKNSVNAAGFGGALCRSLNEKFVLTFDALLYFGGKQNATLPAEAISFSTQPQVIDVPVTRGFILYAGALSLRYYFSGDIEADQGVYGIIGIGATKGRVKNKTIGSYDQSRYYLKNGTEGNVDGIEGFTANLGLGYEKAIGNIYFLTEAKYHYLVLDNSDADATGFVLPSALTLDVGLRFPFN